MADPSAKQEKIDGIKSMLRKKKSYADIIAKWHCGNGLISRLSKEVKKEVRSEKQVETDVDGWNKNPTPPKIQEEEINNDDVFDDSLLGPHFKSDYKPKVPDRIKRKWKKLYASSYKRYNNSSSTGMLEMLIDIDEWINE